jgi:(2Fe-2S) ferredoxin
MNKILNSNTPMGKCHSTQTADFVLEGRLLGYATDDHGKLKYLRLSTPLEYRIKLPKDLRQAYSPGEWVRVAGVSKLDRQTGRMKLKAEQVTVTRPLSGLPSPAAPSQSLKPETLKPETILVCQKSDCCKLGGKAVAAALQTAIADQGLSHQVVIKGTGCMKRCKAGPNLVMPDKTRHAKIRPEAIPALVEQYFDAPTPAPARAVPAEPLSKAS